MQRVAIPAMLVYAGRPPGDPSPMFDLVAAITATPAGIGVLMTGLVLGIRHGIDWDHIAAITDITITGEHHGHGGQPELRAHATGPGAATLAPAAAGVASGVGGASATSTRWEAVRLGTLYALGHGAVVVALGIAALSFGALLPEWLDPIMGRIVGLTLVALGVWVLYSVYRYAVGGDAFHLRSRWMLVFDVVRYGWRRFQSRVR